MDYEKLHKDTIAKLQEMVNSGKITVEIARGICADFIPESEDERIRKALMQNLKERFGTKGNMGEGLDMPNVLDWLEKQGEHEPVVIIPKFRVGDVIRPKGSTAEYAIESISGECYHGKGWGLYIGYEEDYELVEQKSSWSEEDEIIRETLKLIVKCAYDKYGIQGKEIGEEKLLAWLEKQDKKKSIDDLTQQEAMDIAVAKCFEWDKQKPADNVEPKFEIGDLITNGVLVGEIDEIRELGYHACFGDHYADIPDIENWHKWTIQDAKAGDLFADDYGIYIFDRFDEYDERCFLCMGAYQYSQKVFESEHMLCSVEVHPATKEQSLLLFQKMHEAGYEWDAEKKELKKIEQKPAWSEEDKVILDEIIDFFENGTVKLQHDLSLYASWLKSLRPQLQWKPSGEQMGALDDVISLRDIKYGVLSELWNNLKKLREK